MIKAPHDIDETIHRYARVSIPADVERLETLKMIQIVHCEYVSIPNSLQVLYRASPSH